MNKQEFRQLIREEIQKVIREYKEAPITFHRDKNLVSLKFSKTDKATFEKYVNLLKKLASKGEIPMFTDEGMYFGPRAKDTYSVRWEGNWPRKNDKEYQQAIKSAGIDFVIKSSMEMGDGTGMYPSSAYRTISRKLTKYIPSITDQIDFKEAGFKYYGVGNIADKNVSGSRSRMTSSDWAKLSDALIKMYNELKAGKSPKQLMASWKKKS